MYLCCFVIKLFHFENGGNFDKMQNVYISFGVEFCLVFIDLQMVYIVDIACRNYDTCVLLLISSKCYCFGHFYLRLETKRRDWRERSACSAYQEKLVFEPIIFISLSNTSLICIIRVEVQYRNYLKIIQIPINPQKENQKSLPFVYMHFSYTRFYVPLCTLNRDFSGTVEF